jgi:succinate-acetate transporter protein
MENKFSAAASLGYASLFISMWMWYMNYTGWTAIGSASDIVPIMMILGIVIALSGIFSFLNGDRVEPILFLIVAAYLFSYSLRFVMYPNLPANTNAAITDGWFHILIAVVIFCLWLGSLNGKVLRQLFFLGLWLAELGAAISNWTAATIFAMIAGYIGLISAILAALYFFSTIERKKESPVSQTE